MKIIDRVFQYIEYKEFKIAEYERRCSLSNGYLGKMKFRSADIGESILMSILENSHEINTEWLVTGKGEMLKSGTSNPSEPTKEDRLLLINESQQRTIEELTGIVKTLTSK